MVLYQYISNTYCHRFKIVLTFKCNFNCEYCAVKYSIWKDRKSECKVRTPDEWANAINRVVRRGIVLNGGEPTQYPGLYELLAKVDLDRGISLYTNMSFDIRDFIKNVKRNLGFLLSYHPDYGNVDEFIENFRLLAEHDRFRFVLHGVQTNPERDAFVQKKFDDADIPFHLERDCNEELKDWLPLECIQHPKEVICTVKNHVFGPDGSRYQCACHAYRLVDPMENICNGDPLNSEVMTVNCNDFGWCHLADVKENITVIERRSQ